MGAKEEGGISIGFSPAATEREHAEAYHLPNDYMDLTVYTGFGYSGRNLILTRSSDAVIIGCGRIGTINEFTVAYEDQRPIGILRGSWDTDETLKEILDRSHRGSEKVVFDEDPKRLIEKVIEMIKKDKETVAKFYRNGDGVKTNRGNRIL
jgi:uncharacterized protein (TIGR00725 family)